MEVILDEKVINEKEFAGDPHESNRIWIGDRTIEDWIGAKTGKSLCATCAKILGKEVKCRTIKFEGKTYEAIPASLVVKAGLVAAAKLLSVETAKPCCGDESPGHEPCETCPKKR